MRVARESSSVAGLHPRRTERRGCDELRDALRVVAAGRMSWASSAKWPAAFFVMSAGSTLGRSSSDAAMPHAGLREFLGSARPRRPFSRPMSRGERGSGRWQSCHPGWLTSRFVGHNEAVTWRSGSTPRRDGIRSPMLDLGTSSSIAAARSIRRTSMALIESSSSVLIQEASRWRSSQSSSPIGDLLVIHAMRLRTAYLEDYARVMRCQQR